MIRFCWFYCREYRGKLKYIKCYEVKVKFINNLVNMDFGKLVN